MPDPENPNSEAFRTSRDDLAPARHEPEDQSIEDLVSELRKNIPLKCPIVYQWSESEGRERRTTNTIQLCALQMLKRHPWLSFDALDSLVFHHDYNQALSDLSARIGQVCEATKEDSGAGVAMVVDVGEKCVVVMEATLALGASDTANVAKMAHCLDTIMHELCHVHDQDRLRKLLPHEIGKKKVVGIEQHVFAAAQATWSEYFANKYSHSMFSDHAMHPKYLAIVIPDVVQSVAEAVRNFRTDNQVDELLAISERKVRFLLQCFGYAAGRLEASQKTLEDVAPESYAALLDTGLLGVWEAVCVELAHLDSYRDSWTSFDDTKPLMNVADEAYKILGIYITENGSGLRINTVLVT